MTTIRACRSAADHTAEPPAAADLVPLRSRPRTLAPWSLAALAAAAAALAGLVVFGLDAFGDIAQPGQAVASVTATPGTTASVTPAAERGSDTQPRSQAPAVAAARAALTASPPLDLSRPDERASPVAPPLVADNRIAVSPPTAAPADPRPPAPRAPALKLSPDDIAVHLARGEERLKRGELAAARLYFERAALAGDRRGAHGMARTYDAAVLAGLPVLGPQPDPAAARQWYQRAETQSAAR